MALPRVYRIGGNGPIATYNYTDIAEGTGVVVFYGYTHTETSTTSHAITTQTPYSQTMWTTATTSQTDYTKIMDLDFDLTTFNMRKSLKGKVNINATLGVSEPATANVQETVYIKALIRKYDGTTETEIANDRSMEKALGNTSGTGYADYWLFNWEVNCSTITHFKKGDILRVTLEVYAKKTGSNGGAVYLLHDPKNRTNDGTAIVTQQIVKANNGYSAGYSPITSQLKISVPFLIAS